MDEEVGKPDDRSADSAVLNHVGHCVTDLERSVRFYCELFGFRELRRLTVADSPTSKLLRVEPPVGLTAVYLEKGSTVLELLTFDRAGNPPSRERPFTEPGLTHMSFSVEDMDHTKRIVVELGGAVLEGTDIGAAYFVRDPDGQLIEILPMSYRRSLEG